MNGDSPIPCIVVLGPTASGKTRLGVHLARAFGGEIVSVDSRQVYRGLDIGSGKDLNEYAEGGAPVPYHLIDIVDLHAEFSVFDYQRACYESLKNIRARAAMPILVGGTGLYLDAVLKGYAMIEVPEDPALRAELAEESQDQLVARLKSLRPTVHNTTDTLDRARLVRAIEIAMAKTDHAPTPMPLLPILLGIRWPREELKHRIRLRLRQRIEDGLIEEVQGLRAMGFSDERLNLLGLEYRYVMQYFDGTIRSVNDLAQKLSVAIAEFSRKQESWFRRMERHGATIHWIDRADTERAHRIALTELARAHRQHSEAP